MKTSNEFAALLLACERIADGPQTYSEAKTAEDWAEFYLEQAKAKASPEDSQMSNWQPIGHAPKDGSEFVAAYGHQGFVKQLVRYNKLRGLWYSKGEVLLGFEANATHCFLLPPSPASE